MKIIKYEFITAEINHGTEDQPNVELVISNKSIECPTQVIFDANYPIAEKEAIPSTIDVIGEFDPETVSEPTTDDVLTALLGV